MEVESIYGNLPILETERLILRKLTMNDLEDIYSYASNEEVSKYVTWETHRTLTDTTNFIEYVLNLYENKQVAPWAIEHKKHKTCIGTIDFVWWQPAHKSAELGYVISHKYWGMGIATEAAQKLITFGFENMELERIQARCFIENTRSERVMKKIGMTFEGIIRKGMYIKGKHWDLKLYSILKEEFLSLYK